MCASCCLEFRVTVGPFPAVCSRLQAVYWNDAGELVVLACEDSYYVLRYNRDAVAAGALATGELAAQIAEEGVETAFDLCHEIPEKLRTGQW